MCVHDAPIAGPRTAVHASGGTGGDVPRTRAVTDAARQEGRVGAGEKTTLNTRYRDGEVVNNAHISGGMGGIPLRRRLQRKVPGQASTRRGDGSNPGVAPPSRRCGALLRGDCHSLGCRTSGRPTLRSVTFHRLRLPPLPTRYTCEPNVSSLARESRCALPALRGRSDGPLRGALWRATAWPSCRLAREPEPSWETSICAPGPAGAVQCVLS
jgi:hypothetical protein